MCIELAKRVLEATELIFKHKDAALYNADYNFKRKHKVEKYLWVILKRIGIDDTEMGLRLIETKLVKVEDFSNSAKSLKSVWKRLAWDIITNGSIKWPIPCQG